MRAKLSLFLFFTLLLVLGGCIPSPAAEVHGNLLNIGLSPISPTISFTCTNNPRVFGTNLLVGPTGTLSPSNGFFSTNLAGGGYIVRITPYVFGISVPDDNNSYDIGQLANLPAFSWTNLATGSFKVLPSDTYPNFAAAKVLAGSGIVIVTNNPSGNASLVISASSATNFTGSLAGDVTGTQGATVINPAVTNLLVETTDPRALYLPNAGNKINGAVASATNFSGSLAGDVTGTQGATAIAQAVTNGFVRANITNGFVGASVTNGFVGPEITNSLAANVPFINPAGHVNTYPNATTNVFTGYVNVVSQTMGFGNGNNGTVVMGSNSISAPTDANFVVDNLNVQAHTGGSSISASLRKSDGTLDNYAAITMAAVPTTSDANNQPGRVGLFPLSAYAFHISSQGVFNGGTSGSYAFLYEEMTNASWRLRIPVYVDAAYNPSSPGWVDLVIFDMSPTQQKVTIGGNLVLNSNVTFGANGVIGNQLNLTYAAPTISLNNTAGSTHGPTLQFFNGVSGGHTQTLRVGGTADPEGVDSLSYNDDFGVRWYVQRGGNMIMVNTIIATNWNIVATNGDVVAHGVVTGTTHNSVSNSVVVSQIDTSGRIYSQSKICVSNQFNSVAFKATNAAPSTTELGAANAGIVFWLSNQVPYMSIYSNNAVSTLRILGTAN